MYSSTKHYCIINIRALGFVGSEVVFLCVCVFFFSYISHHKPMADKDTPLSVACMDPSGIFSRIYKENFYALLHTKYKCSGLYLFF